jgi:hypothetical protein
MLKVRKRKVYQAFICVIGTPRKITHMVVFTKLESVKTTSPMKLNSESYIEHGSRTQPRS